MPFGSKYITESTKCLRNCQRCGDLRFPLIAKSTRFRLRIINRYVATRAVGRFTPCRQTAFPEIWGKLCANWWPKEKNRTSWAFGDKGFSRQESKTSAELV